MKKQEMHYCQRCKQATMQESHKVNHMVHLLMSLITAGFWLPVWLFLTLFGGKNLNGKNYRCCVCGTSNA
ncbi:MAG: hypothetical protein GF334_05480 [Candidatus Altiarchaeales archaeon]|nr:hypothetical protein [Candidatus Altiarchaeales archaeon]